MTACAAGQVLCGDDGRLHIRIGGEQYYLYPEDIGLFFFAGECAPLLKKGPVPQVHEVSGTIGLNPFGRAVVIAIDKQRYMLPRDKFLSVALGEEISCTFFETPTDGLEIERFSLHKGGAAS